MISFRRRTPQEEILRANKEMRRDGQHRHVGRRARVRTLREGPWVVVERVKADGSFDWFTWHLTRRGARRAAARYSRAGKVKGWKP